MSLTAERAAATDAPTGGYGAGARLLHHLALSGGTVAEASFDLDQALGAATRRDTHNDRHVFVAGLARAGTTILMRRLYLSSAFRSLTYRDMPFVLAPNLWRRLAWLGARDMAANERAHGDGLLVDFDSPEALEEVFWRVFCGNDYLLGDRLVPMTASAAVRTKFARYVDALLQAHPGKRYLSKNNNNILRLPSLAAALPNAVILVPFRAPLAQAASLARQHRHFCSPQHDSAFTRRYMGWLAHHEFGPGLHPFAVGGGLPPGDPASGLDYWLAQWIAIYRFLLETAPAQVVFVSYEQLCGETGRLWPALCRHLDLPACEPAEALRMPPPVQDVPADPRLKDEATALHARLLARAL